MSDSAPHGVYCPSCDGTGTMGHVRSGDSGASYVIAKCSTCDGEGVIPFPACRRCSDTGYVHDAAANRFDRCGCRPLGLGGVTSQPRHRLLPWEWAVIAGVTGAVFVALAEMASAISKL